MTSIPITPVHRHAPPPKKPYEAPYRWFIAASLAVAVSGGFALAIAVSLAGALEWNWGTDQIALAQAHGQLQLVGFGGLFIAGMAMRLLPRFGGRPLAHAWLAVPVLVLLAASVTLRALAQPFDSSGGRDAALLLSAVLFVAGAAGFFGVIWGTAAHPRTRAQSTAWFFCAGSLGLLAASLLNLAIVIEMARDELPFAPTPKSMTLVFLEQYGFNLMFICGIATRALPTLGGHQQPHGQARYVAAAIGAGVAIFGGCTLRMAYSGHTDALARGANAGLLLVAAGFVAIAWLSGALRQAANRVGGASQTQFWFARAGMAWLAVSGILLAWYALRALGDDTTPDPFEFDAVRHTLALGVLTMMIIGVAMLIVPEFAGRRLQRPNEKALVIAMLVALNAAVVLRIWPSIEGIDWLESTRYWPMATAGFLAEGVITVFALMFAQSYIEQRRPGWSTPEGPERD